MHYGLCSQLGTPSLQSFQIMPMLTFLGPDLNTVPGNWANCVHEAQFGLSFLRHLQVEVIGPSVSTKIWVKIFKFPNKMPPLQRACLAAVADAHLSWPGAQTWFPAMPQWADSLNNRYSGPARNLPMSVDIQEKQCNGLNNPPHFKFCFLFAFLLYQFKSTKS